MEKNLCGVADNKDPAADQSQTRTGKPNALDGMVFCFNSFMFKNPGMQVYLMSVIASDPAAETIKESVKNQDKSNFVVEYLAVLPFFGFHCTNLRNLCPVIIQCSDLTI